MPDFDATDAAVINVMGENVSYTPFGMALVVVLAFFQAPDEEPDTQDLQFIATGPQVTLLESDAPAPNKGDLFTVRGQTYTVKDFETDESALVVFHLLET